MKEIFDYVWPTLLILNGIGNAIWCVWATRTLRSHAREFRLRRWAEAYEKEGQ